MKRHIATQVNTIWTISYKLKGQYFKSKGCCKMSVALVVTDIGFFTQVYASVIVVDTSNINIIIK